MRNEDIITFEDFKRESKKRAVKDRINRWIQNGKEWFFKNKDAVITLTPVVIAGVTTVVKVVGKRVNLGKQEDIKNLYCYDRSLGHYWRLRRELSNKEWLEIDRRKKDGERLADILSDMRVLK